MSPHHSRLRGASRRRRILPVFLFLSLLLCTARLATSGPLPPNAAAAAVARGGPAKGSSVVGDVVVDDDDDDESAAAEGTVAADETKDADGTTTAADDQNDAIDSIVSKITSWTKEKHRRAKRSSRSRKSLEEDDILELQRRRPPRDLPLPFVTLAYAQTLDGMIAAIVDDDDDDGGGTGTAAPSSSLLSSNLRLSGPESTILTHRLRSVHDAILVGGTTFLVDGPRLNVRLPKEYDRGVVRTTIGHHQQPVPVVLDTHLNNLQTLLFGEVVVVCDDASIIGEGGALIPDIGVEKIRARHPVVCCTSDAAHSFLDTLEIFQEQQSTIRKPKRSYKITVYKKIDEEFGHERDIYLPIKISVRVTTHGNSRKHQEDAVEELTFTLLPCPTTAVADGGNKAKRKREESSSSSRRRRLDLRQVLCQLRDQFDVGSVMVEGGAGILSSFLNEQRVCVDNDDAEDGDSSDCDDGASSDGRVGGGGTVVDCVCVTIAPGVIGGKQGLPALGGLDTMRPRSQSGGGGDDDEDDDNNTGMLPGMVTFRKVEFVPLGLDCTFLGRL